MSQKTGGRRSYKAEGTTQAKRGACRDLEFLELSHWMPQLPGGQHPHMYADFLCFM